MPVSTNKLVELIFFLSAKVHLITVHLIIGVPLPLIPSTEKKGKKKLEKGEYCYSSRVAKFVVRCQYLFGVHAACLSNWITEYCVFGSQPPLRSPQPSTKSNIPYQRPEVQLCIITTFAVVCAITFTPLRTTNATVSLFKIYLTIL